MKDENRWTDDKTKNKETNKKHTKRVDKKPMKIEIMEGSLLSHVIVINHALFNEMPQINSIFVVTNDATS